MKDMKFEVEMFSFLSTTRSRSSLKDTNRHSKPQKLRKNLTPL